ncbi:hypothetical protein [Candidatus Nitrosopumilus sediminis]|uniref:Uncharacterized protein n=1 Tax=Candidatus Nitrosopumilus sediminis TaxID=1229909 RepID=K0BCK8_9ARCH|nr:hypothetical protein [Candidatus Nitrosopumilus sediminis]AFS82760.1 hypothetical protein NSED_04780 [Candidatus Nitrosopumilus sediminis]
MKSRRGLSTVVGAVFFVIAATTVITYISYSMNSIDEFAQSVIVSEAENINRGMEEISISQARIVDSKFNATVINTGSLPVKLTRLWVVDEDSGLNSKEDLDITINPGNLDYIDESSIPADSTKSYTLKAVTSRGNIATFSVSPDVSTQIQLIVPAEIQPLENFRVVSMITNNSTLPNNIANLVPTIASNVTLTEIDGPLPPAIQSLPQGNTATFTYTYTAPETTQGLLFNASYTGAPTGSFVISNTTVALSGEAEAATSSQWSQAASRVGILISGIPNPMSSATNTDNFGKWGIGIINPLDRNVEVYSVGILIPDTSLMDGFNPIEPSTGWSSRVSGDYELLIWEGGTSPVTIGQKSVGQFRVETTFSQNALQTYPYIIQALTSEGKLSVEYTVTSNSNFPLVNTFYTGTPSDPLNNWTYIISNIPSGKNEQIFNATIHNGGSTMASKVILLILVPADFKDVVDESAGTGGWNEAEIVKNPDGSHIIKVETSNISFASDDVWTYQFNATNPTVSDDKLFVFQTTTIYPSFTGVGKSQLISALSEAGVEVVP